MSISFIPVTFLGIRDYQEALPELQALLDQRFPTREFELSMESVPDLFPPSRRCQLTVRFMLADIYHSVTSKIRLRYDGIKQRNIVSPLYTGGRILGPVGMKECIETWISRLEWRKLKGILLTRVQNYKEELMEKCWEPRRIQRWLESGMTLEDVIV